ncbi:hypothetical protein LXL04_018235 [Taraxacum kok-saghyz]
MVFGQAFDRAPGVLDGWSLCADGVRDTPMVPDGARWCSVRHLIEHLHGGGNGEVEVMEEFHKIHNATATIASKRLLFTTVKGTDSPHSNKLRTDKTGGKFTFHQAAILPQIGEIRGHEQNK